jgi:hypothetical protein
MAVMQGYKIEPQEEGRGDNKHEVLIKQTTKGVATDKMGKKTGMFPLKAASGNTLPCLKVKLSHPERPDHRFEVRWSNYYEQKGANPGKFKLVHVETKKPVLLYVTDSGNGRKRFHKGNPQIDYVGMAVQFGSTYDKATGWEFGENQPFNEESSELWEHETIDQAFLSLAERFGEELAHTVMVLFLTHSLFGEFAVAIRAAA